MEPLEYDSIETYDDFVNGKRKFPINESHYDDDGDDDIDDINDVNRQNQNIRRPDDPFGEQPTVNDGVRTKAELLLNASKAIEINRENGKRKKLEDVLVLEQERLSFNSKMWCEASKHSAFAFLNEENDDAENIHQNDQLPHVEEVRSRSMNATYTQQSRRRRKWCCLCPAPHHIRLVSRKTILITLSIVSLIALVIGVSIGISTHHSSIKGSSERTEGVLIYLENVTMQQESLRKNDSPQHKAAIWMAEKDILQYPIPASTNEDAVTTSNSFLQRYALAVLYYALGGEEWTTSLNFLSNEHECSWYQDLPSLNGTFNYAIGVSCNDHLKVDGILIPKNNLAGTLPYEMGLLEDLRFIIAPRNYITGSIDFARDNNTIDVINLKENSLTGPLPPNIGRMMEGLRILELSNNRIDSTLPESMKLLTNLQTLALDSNQFTGETNVLNNIRSLEFVNLENNLFTGTLDANRFLVDLKNLSEFDLSDNKLSGTLPSHLFSHKSLQVLDLSNNMLTGELPNHMNENKELKYLSLSNNTITGIIPTTISALKELTYFDISHNELTGQIEPNIGLMKAMKYLFLDNNYYFDRYGIPDFLQGLTDLRQLSLGYTNRIGGPIPADWLTKLHHLNLLDLRDNSLGDEDSSSTVISDSNICNALPNLLTLAVNCGDGMLDCRCCLCCEVTVCSDDNIVFADSKEEFTISTKSFIPQINYD